MQASSAAARVAGSLTLTFGDKQEKLTLEELAALPHNAVTVFNKKTNARETYSGVLLFDLLVKVGVSAKPHGKDLLLYVLPEGADGYRVTYSIDEVTPALHDATVIVADSMDGKPLTTTGPLEIIDSRDSAPERWVRNLVAVRVRAAE